MKACLLMSFFILLTACRSSKVTTGANTKVAITESDKSGIELIKKSDCYVCHSVMEKLNGPSFENIAKKYAVTNENLQKLSEKIINGSNGSWGQIPMTPHPAISKKDAEEMVKYILLLKQ